MIQQVIHSNCIEYLKNIPDNYVDLIFADPPYNLQISDTSTLIRPNDGSKVDGVTDYWDSFIDMSHYIEFTESWLTECRRILKKDGSIWVMGMYHNIYEVGYILKKLGFWILNDIYWFKTNPMPNFKGTRFQNATESLIWASHSKSSKYTFNYNLLKTYNEGLQMKNVWELPVCRGNERIKLSDNKAHSTQIPESLLYRVLISNSNENDLVLDPFSGTGTTAAVCKKLNRNYIAIEQDKFYIDIINQRLKNTIQGEYINNNYKFILDKKINVKFSELIDYGYLKPNYVLHSKDRKFEATILPEARLLYNNNSYSIHELAKLLNNNPGTNGYDYWYYNNNCINNIRKELALFKGIS